MSSPYTVCEYVGRNGYCGKRCFGGRCNIHRKRETLALCLEECGRGTASITGYCNQCGYKQMTVWADEERYSHDEQGYRGSTLMGLDRIMPSAQNPTHCGTCNVWITGRFS